MARLICCSLAVEVKGRPLHPDKSAKEHGIRIKEATDYGLPAVLVLGYKRSLSFTVKEVRQVVDSRLSAGRLAFVSQDGTQVLATKALEEELKEVVKVLRWQAAAPPRPQDRSTPLSQSVPSLQSGASVSRVRAGLRRAEASTATAGAVAVAKAQAKAKGADSLALGSCAVAAESAPVALGGKRLKVGQERSGNAASLSPRAGLESLPSTVLSIIWEMEPSDGPWRRVAESCSQLAAFFDEQNWTFRLNSRAKGVTLDSSRILQLLSRRPGRRVVDLSGFRELTAGAGASLADTLSGGLGSQLERLVLRGCRLLTDVAVRRMLSACPHLQVLDLLEIPRLSSRAFEAPLPRLRVLAAGSLGGVVAAERPRWGTEVDRGALTNISGVVGSSLAKPRQRAAAVLGSVQITALLLNRLSQRPSLADGATRAATGAGGAPLTHVILAHCAEIRVLPRLPASLLHLDLRGANIEVPEASLQSWRPLAACPELHSLCLAGNDLLSSAALQACLASLPPAARLQALDLSGTRLQGPLLAQLPQLQPSITHLSIAGCAAARNSCVAGLLSRLRELKVLDISGCAGLEMPFATIVDSVKTDAGVAEGAPSEERSLALAHLQLVGLGRTELGAHLDETRRALHVVAPSARVLASSVDIFSRYEVLPPVLL